MNRRYVITGIIISICFMVGMGFLTIAQAVEWVGERTLDIASLPDLDVSPTQTTKIYDDSGELMYEIGSVHRRVVDVEQVPEVVKDAFLAAEDKTFYTNPGFSISSVIRAAKVDLQHDQLLQGGSTITQQLAQMLIVSKENTLERKVKELAASVMLTQKYSKDAILERYLNEVPVGGELVGVGTAAEKYFGIEVQDLSMAQGAYLAALINAPGILDPYLNPQGLQQRQRLVLDRMHQFGYIDQTALEHAKQEEVVFLPRKSVLRYPYFSFYVRHLLEEKFGQEVVNGGLTVYTSLNQQQQELAEETIKQQLKANTERWKASNASLIAVDPKSSQITAYIGGVDFHSSQVDINRSRRQPGSTIKPLIYYTAFAQGYEPTTYVSDAAEDFGGGWRPLNYGGWASGRYVTLRTALASSLNIPAVRVLRGVGIPAATESLKLMGFPIIDGYNYTLPLALGAVEVSPLDMAQSFAMLANGGRQAEVSPLVKVVNRDGRVLLDRSQPKLGEQVLDKKAVEAVSSILSDYALKRSVYAGQGYVNYTLADRPAAAKTGTSSGPKDAWTIGYTPQLLTVVWTGNTSGKDLAPNTDGLTVAAPIWHNFMTAVLKGQPVEKFAEYPWKNPDASKRYIDRWPGGQAPAENAGGGR